jgi:hypothetical protein
MNSIFRWLWYLFGIIIIFVIHVLVLNILPSPFNHIHIILIAFLWLTIYSGSHHVLWLMLPLAFLLELFVAFPYGLTSLALFSTTVIMFWMLMNIFTNRSLYIVLLSGFLATALFRFFSIIFLLLVNMFNANFTISWSEVLSSIFYEIIFTTTVFFLFYLLTLFFFRKFNTKYIPRQNAYGTKRFI